MPGLEIDEEQKYDNEGSVADLKLNAIPMSVAASSIDLLSHAFPQQWK